MWIVEFYAPWSGDCQRLEPKYKKAAKALKGVVKVSNTLDQQWKVLTQKLMIRALIPSFLQVSAVNADEHRSIGDQFRDQGVPTIKIFVLDKNKPEDYNGGLDAQVSD